MPKAVSEDVRKIAENWRSIVSQMPGSLKAYMQKAHISVGENDVLLIVFEDSISYEMAATEEHQKETAENISNAVGKEVSIKMMLNETGQTFENAFVDLEQMIHTEIEYEDFTDNVS